MHRAFLRPAFAALAVLACAATLAGCGRKGALEPPPGVALSPAQSAASRSGSSQAAQTRVLQDLDTPGLIQSPNQVYEESAIAKLNSAVKNPARPINAPPEPARGGFSLDPLLR